MKAKLFTADYTKAALICVDDAWGQRLAASVTVPLETYSVPRTRMVRASMRPPVGASQPPHRNGRLAISGCGPGKVRRRAVANCRASLMPRNALAAIAAVTTVGSSLGWHAEGSLPARQCLDGCSQSNSRVRSCPYWSTTHIPLTRSVVL